MVYFPPEIFIFTRLRLHIVIFFFCIVDLLVIEANKPAEKKVSYQRTGGDWFEHVNNNDNATTNKNSFANKKNMTPVRPSSAAGKSFEFA